MHASQLEPTDPITESLPPKILKSGVLCKKDEYLMGSYTKYTQSLFELTIDGEFICYNVQSNGTKIKKSSLQLTPTTKIEKRSGGIGARRNAKFIIHSDHSCKWYMWCNAPSKPSLPRRTYPSKSICPCSPRSRTNPISSQKHFYDFLFPFHRYHIDETPSVHLAIPTHHERDNNTLSASDGYKPRRHSLYTSLASVTVQRDCIKADSLLSPKQSMINLLRTRKHSVDYDLNQGMKEAQEWCHVLQWCIHHLICAQSDTHSDRHIAFHTLHIPSNIERFSLQTLSQFDEELYDDIDIPWTLKQGHMMLKVDRHGYGMSMYKRMYFVLRMNGLLEFYRDETETVQIGAIDILNECTNVSMRTGSRTRECKFVVFTPCRHYYFWCKGSKELCGEWHFVIENIIHPKTNNIRQFLKTLQSKDEHQSIPPPA